MRVGIALGSNVGDRAAHLQNAFRALCVLGTPPVLASRIYETAPVDCPPASGNFLNAAAEIGWDTDIRALLRRLQALERDFGRDEIRPRHAPRPLDLDILYADNLQINDPDLRIPHPRILERAFVLIPLRDIVPTFRHPAWKQTVAEAAHALGGDEIKNINLYKSFLLNDK